MEYPEDLRYSREHEWARSENGRVRVGITDFAQDALGDVVYVDLPEPGTQVTSGQAFGEVESTIRQRRVRTGLRNDRGTQRGHHPELVNEHPYGDGWLVAIDPADPPTSMRCSMLRRTRSSSRAPEPRTLDVRPILQRRSRVTAEPGRG